MDDDITIYEINNETDNGILFPVTLRFMKEYTESRNIWVGFKVRSNLSFKERFWFCVDILRNKNYLPARLDEEQLLMYPDIIKLRDALTQHLKEIGKE